MLATTTSVQSIHRSIMLATTTSVPFWSRNIAICKANRHPHHGRLFLLFGGINNNNNNNMRYLSAAAVRTQEAPPPPPMLMLSSPTKPDYRYLFDITFTDDQKKLQLNREIHLPDISNNLFIGSSEGLLISIPAFGSSPDITVLDPLTGSHLSLLNKVPSMTGCKKKVIAPQDFLKIAYDFEELCESKAIVSPSLDAIVLFTSSQLYFTGFGGSTHHSSSWNSFPSILNLSGHKLFLHFMNDCIFHKGRLHIADYSGNLAIVDFKDPLSPLFFLYMDNPVDRNWMRSNFKWYLVESPNGDDLFLLYRAPEDADTTRTEYFYVFKLDKDLAKWNQVESIGGIAMFVGRNCSMSIFVRDFPNLKSNSIYFTYDLGQADEYYNDTGVFTLEEKEIHLFDLTDDVLGKLNYLPPIWFSPSITMF